MRLNLEGNGNDRSRAGRLSVEYEEIVVVDTGSDRTASCVFQAVFHHHVRLAVRQPQCLAIDVGIARRRISQLLSEHDGLAIVLDRAFPRVDDLEEPVVVVLAFVGLAKSAYTNLDEAAAGLGLIPSDGCELIYRTGDRGTRTGHDVRVPVHKIVHARIGFLKPRPVVVVSVVPQAVDDSRPIEPGGAIVSIFRIGQVYLGMDLAVGDLGVRRLSGAEKSQAQKCQGKSPCHHRKIACRGYVSDQPLRNVGLRYLFASGLLVNRILAASHSSLPSTRKAITPSSIHSTKGTATSKFEHAGSPPLQARIQSR